MAKSWVEFWFQIIIKIFKEPTDLCLTAIGWQKNTKAARKTDIGKALDDKFLEMFLIVRWGDKILRYILCKLKRELRKHKKYFRAVNRIEEFKLNITGELHSVRRLVLVLTKVYSFAFAISDLV
jgi:hypothetical protein